jgi:hypothetical protein
MFSLESKALRLGSNSNPKSHYAKPTSEWLQLPHGRAVFCGLGDMQHHRHDRAFYRQASYSSCLMYLPYIPACRMKFLRVQVKSVGGRDPAV